MESLEAIQRRIQSAVDLHGIVRTMKTLAAANIRQFDRASEAVNIYSQTIDMGLRIVLHDKPQSPTARSTGSGGSIGAIIFGTDQGMCGQFNENIVRYAVEDVHEQERVNTFSAALVIGMRAGARLQEMGVPFQRLFPVPSSVEGINAAVQSLLMAMRSWRQQENIESVFVYFNRPTSGSSYQAARVQLFPINTALFHRPEQNICHSRSLPVYTIDRSRLLPLLLRQYIFVQIFRAYTESLTSENTSRLLTMQAAEKNIEERLNELRASFHSHRQGAITSELLDIVSGFEVLGS
jgi:F-type H+-transporting ATPase subunit gamma